MTEAERQFQNRVDEALAKISPETLSFNEEEFWMMKKTYEYIEYCAFKKQHYNTMIALPLCVGLHDGQHRKKSTMTRDGVSFKVPYVNHCLAVCRMLLDLHLPICDEEEDWILAAALCHDMIEDIPFENGGTELMTQFGLSEEVYRIVKTLSKRDDFTLEEHQAYFRHIQEDRLALLIKLADRGHNVEDLYNMSLWKVHEYVGETKDHFFPMCSYGKQRYGELLPALEILEEKMETLTVVSEILADRCAKMETELMKQIGKERKENDRLRNWLEDYQNRMREAENEAKQ